MANPTADQSLADQVAEAFTEATSRVKIEVTDTITDFKNTQVDTAVSADIVHEFRIRTKSETLISAIVAALVATGRP